MFSLNKRLKLLEKLSFTRYLDNYENLYLIMNNKSIVTAIIYHNPAKNNFILATLKPKGNLINGNVPRYLSKGDHSSSNRLARMRLVDTNNRLYKPITDPKAIAEYMIKGAKRLGLIKKYYGLLDKEAFIKAMTIKEGVDIVKLQHLIPKADLKPNGVKFHDMKIIGDKQKDIDNIQDLLSDVYKHYKSIKMEKKLMVGDIYLTNALETGKLADYSYGDNSVRITNKARKSDSSVRTLIHEFAHRWWYFYLTADDRKEINSKYTATITNQKSILEIGDRYIHPKFGEIEIESKDYSRRSYEQYYVYRVLKDNTRYRIKDAGSLRGFKKIKGDEDKFDNFDVSNYAKTSALEFWPEVVATALTKNNKELLTWVKGFVK